MCHAHTQGNIAHNIYQIPPVYQRICNQLIQILHWLVDSDLFWAFWWKSRESTANSCKMVVHKTLYNFFWTTLCVYPVMKLVITWIYVSIICTVKNLLSVCRHSLFNTWQTWSADKLRMRWLRESITIALFSPVLGNDGGLLCKTSPAEFHERTSQ